MGRKKTLKKTNKQPDPKHNRKMWIRLGLLLLLGVLVLLFLGADALAQKRTAGLASKINFTSNISSNPLVLVIVLGGMALLPFVLIMTTSFVKIAVVLSIVRSALGTQQNPPTQVITGLAIILTIYVMVPVGLEIREKTDALIAQKMSKNSSLLSSKNVGLLVSAAFQAKDPVRKFLEKHSHDKDRHMFYTLALQLRKPKHRVGLTRSNLTVLIPSFVISELKEAFQIGFLIFLPFIIVDMVVANILLALGMHMLSPTTISLPFKLLLFVMVDGWYLITKGLIISYL